MQWQQDLPEILLASVSGKYPHVQLDQLKQWISDALKSIASRSDPSDILSLLQPTTDPKSDIVNQTVVLYLISQSPHSEVFRSHPLQQIHNCALGKSSSYREVEYVSDFGGVVPTPHQQAKPRFDEVERYFSVLMRVSYPGHRDAASILAYVFSSIIRIHYFADGNGRSARFAFCLLLSCWQQPLIAIPKVRNDRNWKEALNAAVLGDLTALAEQIEMRMRHNGGE